ncbi:MAG: chaperone modulator CbpM [Rhodospirillales bacterium]
MATFDDILRCHHVERVELTAWIEQRWVRPRPTRQGYEFDEVDEARIQLIGELRRDLMLDDDALGLILSLLDQLYATRRMLRSVEEALEALPEPIRQQISAKIRNTL